MKNKFRKPLDKKERRAKIMAHEKNQRFIENEMMREYLEGDSDFEDEYLEELYQEDPELMDPAWENADDEMEEDKINDTSTAQVSFWSFFIMGGLSTLLLFMLAIYFTIQLAGTGEVQETENVIPETEISKVGTVETTEEMIGLEEFFGSESADKASGEMKVYGLSDQMKKKYGFDETAFENDAEIFLGENDVKTDLIYLENRIPCSSEAAVCYIASMAGVPDQMLEVMIYPELPGRYIFMLTEKSKVEIPVIKEVTVQAPETEAPAFQAPQTTQVQEQTNRVIVQMPETNANTYDAERLSIKSIPSELNNYISGEKILQYQLYHYLYSNGYRNVRSAKVTEYSIDGDVRQAVFRLGLDNGNTVSCTYYHDSGTFSFS